ncbi:hypothetical protein SDC9_152390 [bioreactor metagenome]|uniref:Uncharacterized protein n=1 Tax=bioreactor metagenome TaxID=1076179 RepID=A0A645EUL3_9ZZZZ
MFFSLYLLRRAFFAYALHDALVQLLRKFVFGELADALKQRAAMIRLAPAFGAFRIVALHFLGPLAVNVIPYHVFKFTAFHCFTIFAAYLLLNTVKLLNWFLYSRFVPTIPAKR